MTITPGQEIGSYVVRSKIGEGGMGAVYLAEDTTIGRNVVLKVLSTDAAGDEEMLQRFDREVEMIASLEHPHILPVYEFGEVDGEPYIAMRYIRGGSLLDRMHGEGLSREELLRVFDQIAEALDFAHDRGVIHRDLKPANLLLDESGNAYLADFGLAKTMEGSRDLTKTGGILGTPAYMSPEQVRGEKLDRRSDIYCFAIMVFEALSGQNPFKAASPMDYIHKHLMESPRSITSLAKDLPPAADDVLQGALAKDPDQRPTRAMEFMVTLRAALAGGAEPAAIAAEMAAAPRTRPAATAQAAEAPPARAAAAAVPAVERRRSSMPALLGIILGGGALLAALAAVGLFVFRDRLFGPKVVTYPVGDSPRALLFDGEAIWVTNFFDNTLARLSASNCDASPDPCGQATTTLIVPDLPVALAYDGASLWVASALDQALTQLDPASGEEIGRYSLPNVPTALIHAGAHLWTANEFAGSVTKIDLTGSVIGDFPIGSAPRALLWDGQAIWVASESDSLLSSIDPTSGEIMVSYPLDGQPNALAFDGESLWVTLSDRGEALKLDRTDGSILGRVPVGGMPSTMLFDGTTLWVADSQGERLTRINVATATEQTSISVEGGPYALAWVPCGETCGDLWIANESSDSVSRVRVP